MKQQLKEEKITGFTFEITLGFVAAIKSKYFSIFFFFLNYSLVSPSEAVWPGQPVNFPLDPIPNSTLRAGPKPRLSFTPYKVKENVQKNPHVIMSHVKTTLSHGL